MDLLIIYSEEKKGELVSLATLLFEKNIKFNPVPMPLVWDIHQSEDLLFWLKKNTHSVFLVSPVDVNNPFFIFAAGYCLGSHEKSYILDTLGGTFPEGWKGRFNLFKEFSVFMDRLYEEKVRWEQFLDRVDAKGQILERGRDVTNSSLVEAIEEGDIGCVQLFLRAGFSPNLTNKSGVPLICLATRKAHNSIVKLLAEHGADVNLKSRDRENTALMDAAAEGNLDLLATLIRLGADLNQVSRNGQTALVLAVGKGADDVALMLLKAGADPEITDKLGMSAKTYAHLFKRTAVLELLEAQ